MAVVAWDLGIRRGVEALIFTPEEFERARLSPDFEALLEKAREVPAPSGTARD